MPMGCRSNAAAGATAAAAIALLLSANADAAPLSGTFSSPLGTLSLAEKDGAITGKVVDAKKNPCGFAKGHVVLDGSRLDDSVVGTLRACKIGDGCSGPVEGAAMLLITKKGTVISGAVHLEAGACKTPLGGDSVVLKRGAGGGGAAKPPVTGAAPKEKGTPRLRAEKLVADANAQYNADGNAETLRAQCHEAIKIDPGYAEAAICVGVTYYARERYEEALDWYKRALETNPSIGDAYYNMGCVYALKGDAEQALRYLRIALLNGYVQLDTLTSDPDLKSLAGNAAFEKLKQGVTD